MTYETLKNKIAVWQLVTELKKEKQALPVSLSLTGNAEETALEVPAEDLGKADNMEKPTAQLDFFFFVMAKIRHTRLADTLSFLKEQKI